MPGRLSTSSSAMIDSSITFLDSGIGGLPYLDWIRLKRPELPLTYIADTANFPYGDLSPEEIRNAAVEAVCNILKHGTPAVLVVACNTASVTALEEIRAVAPCPVVGTVPAVKPAAGLKVDGPIGVLATSGTVDSPYLDSLVSSFVRGREVVRVSAGDIVRYVEEDWLEDGDQGAIPVMKRAIGTLKESGVGSVVLGCTHFLHLIKPIKKMIGEDVPLVDSRDGVGRRILSIIDEDNLMRDAGASGGTFMVTEPGDSDERYRRFAVLHGLNWAGVIG